MDKTVHFHIDGLVQERRNSSALAMELRLNWNNSFMCIYMIVWVANLKAKSA